MKTVWITKYALTQGIYTVESHEIDGGTLVVQTGPARFAFYHGPEWWKMESAAIAEAEWMRDRKIKSLEKQIAKLRAMTFGSER